MKRLARVYAVRLNLSLLIVQSLQISVSLTGVSTVQILQSPFIFAFWRRIEIASVGFFAFGFCGTQDSLRTGITHLSPSQYASVTS